MCVGRALCRTGASELLVGLKDALRIRFASFYSSGSFIGDRGERHFRLLDAFLLKSSGRY